jgi:hypothetical protein
MKMRGRDANVGCSFRGADWAPTERRQKPIVRRETTSTAACTRVLAHLISYNAPLPGISENPIVEDEPNPQMTRAR